MNAPRTFYFKNATDNKDFAGCPAAGTKQGHVGHVHGRQQSIITFSATRRTEFCSQRLSAGTVFSAGQGQLSVWFQNKDASKICSLTPSVSINGTSSVVTMSTQNIPAASPVTRYDWTFTFPATTLAAERPSRRLLHQGGGN